jgi:hypothetical protein
MLASTLSKVLTALSVCSIATATPLHQLEARNNTGAAQGRKVCVVPSQYAASNGTVDDSTAIVKALTDCSNGGVVQFPMGVD